MFVLKSALLAACLAAASCQYNNNGPTTTPVPILKQINKQNDDGSYSYGYEAADGSFKIETKYPNGDVAGKYGYVDAEGKTREISYGASSKRGFEPQGTGIQVPPPTLNESPSNALTDGQEDDGQYREDPSIYEDPKYNSKGSKSSYKQFLKPVNQGYQQTEEARSQYQVEPRPQYKQAKYETPQPQYQQQQYQNQQYQNPTQFRSTPLYSQQTSLFNQPQQPLFQAPQQSLFQSPQQFTQEYKPQSQVYHQTPQFSYQALTPQVPQYNQQYQSQYQPQNPFPNFNPFSGHPAQNFDPNTGSYTINFTGK